VRSVRELVAHGDVERGVTQFRHRFGLDLADPLSGELEVDAHLFEGAGLPAVEAETQRQDLALTGRERRQEFGDLPG
jgi:hypothetical protein